MSIFIVIAYMQYEAGYESVIVTTNPEKAADAAKNPAKYGAANYHDWTMLEEWNALTGKKITERRYG